MKMCRLLVSLHCALWLLWEPGAVAACPSGHVGAAGRTGDEVPCGETAGYAVYEYPRQESWFGSGGQLLDARYFASLPEAVAAAVSHSLEHAQSSAASSPAIKQHSCDRRADAESSRGKVRSATDAAKRILRKFTCGGSPDGLNSLMARYGHIVADMIAQLRLCPLDGAAAKLVDYNEHTREYAEQLLGTFAVKLWLVTPARVDTCRPSALGPVPVLVVKTAHDDEFAQRCGLVLEQLLASDSMDGAAPSGEDWAISWNQPFAEIFKWF